MLLVFEFYSCVPLQINFLGRDGIISLVPLPCFIIWLVIAILFVSGAIAMHPNTLKWTVFGPIFSLLNMFANNPFLFKGNLCWKGDLFDSRVISSFESTLPC
jgi:hypothetical protein